MEKRGRPRGHKLYSGEHLTIRGYVQKYGGFFQTVRNKARIGEIPFEKHGGEWLISPDKAREYWENWREHLREKEILRQEKRRLQARVRS